jgi:hypothetical protein
MSQLSTIYCPKCPTVYWYEDLSVLMGVISIFICNNLSLFATHILHSSTNEIKSHSDIFSITNIYMLTSC